MITTRITVPRRAQAYVQFAATELGLNVPEVYGALIMSAIEGKGPDEITVLVKPLIDKHFKAAPAPKPKAG